MEETAPYDGSYSVQSEQPAPTYAQWDKDTLSQIINRKDPIESLVDALSGKWTSRDGNVRQGRALMNQEGIDSIVRILASQLSQNIILTDLNEGEVKLMVKMIQGSVLYDLRLHYRDYDLVDTAQMSQVSAIVLSSVYAALKSAQDSHTMDHIAPMYRRTENYGPAPKRSIWPTFGGK